MMQMAGNGGRMAGRWRGNGGGWQGEWRGDGGGMAGGMAGEWQEVVSHKAYSLCLQLTVTAYSTSPLRLHTELELHPMPTA